MDIKSTRAKNEWILNLQESKTNGSQVNKSRKRLNLETTRVQNEWISNLPSVCWRRRQERKRGVLVLDMRKANRFISWSIYRISRALQELLQSRHELHTSGPARRQITSCSREAMGITWHVSVSLDMLAALSLWHGRMAWHRNSSYIDKFLNDFSVF